MADLKIIKKDNFYHILFQGISVFDFPAVGKNKYILILFLRGMKKWEGSKHGLFTQKQIAQAIPDFSGKTKQSINNIERHFAECGYDIKAFLNYKRKIDDEIIESVKKFLRENLLIETKELSIKLNKDLERTDITPQNIRTALASVSGGFMLQLIRKRFTNKTLKYKEEYLLNKTLEELQTKKSNQSNLLSNAKIPNHIKSLFSIDTPISSIPLVYHFLTLLLVLYFYGVPMSSLGRWFGVSKSTIHRWLWSYVGALWIPVKQLLCKVKDIKQVYLDEKWVKIKGHWHYWFVAIDVATELPIYMECLPTLTYWSCTFVLINLCKKFDGIRIIITDGLSSYASVLRDRFPNVSQQLCIFHFQQSITRWLKEHIEDKDLIPDLKKEMKEVIRAKNVRTVKKRLNKLKEKTKIVARWVENTIRKLPALVLTLKRTYVPRTNNVIERFFRAYNRFEKVRKGFQNKESADRHFMLFLIVYVFQKQDNGKAPIEKIIPEASKMPLYQMINYPFEAFKCQPNNISQYISSDCKILTELSIVTR